ncbi:hypothetical protein FF011L_23750 [Roseimaritima multifibrata]|uniref:Uncharacterized protein n=1 Tax=Roseimaritima multifibrata TaxID=1930274 RepID=A0A517MFD0_9BACT|nr:hypothetical protein FF011L_23750 [Roseimaritima multifibrata]
MKQGDLTRKQSTQPETSPAVDRPAKNAVRVDCIAVAPDKSVAQYLATLFHERIGTTPIQFRQDHKESSSH